VSSWGEISLIAALAKITWLIVAFDTAGEVLEALVRCIGIVKIPSLDVEVPHASPDADRACPS
jgi:hypothetical protein